MGANQESGHARIRIGEIRLVHRWILRRYGIPARFVLNAGPVGPGDHAPPFRPAADLRRIVQRMQADARTSDGRRLDYARLRASPTFVEYRACALRLQSFDPGALGSREERLAFWINLYNALIVDAVLSLGVRSSITEVPGFLWRAAYAVGGRRYCAFDIEYGILRANAPHPVIPGAHFGRRDARRRYSLDRLDPRVHFALVCGARSCPPIAVYDPDRIDEQLDLAAHAFIQDGGVVVERASGEVRLSQIFQWYAPDFGGRPFGLGDKRPLLAFAARYLDHPADRAYLSGGNPAVRFIPYDWRLNSAG